MHGCSEKMDEPKGVVLSVCLEPTLKVCEENPDSIRYQTLSISHIKQLWTKGAVTMYSNT